MSYLPLWMTNSAAFGGGEEKRLPMWTKVSSITPVGATCNNKHKLILVLDIYFSIFLSLCLPLVDPCPQRSLTMVSQASPCI